MSRGQMGVRDWLIAVGVAAILLVTGLSEQDSAANLDLLGYGLLTASGLALAARRRAPVPVLAVTGLCAVGYQAAGVDVPAVAYLFAVYAAVRAGQRTITVVASVLMLAALPLAAMASGLHDTGEAFAQARGALELAWLIAAGAAGEALRQAERRADEAERTREETARRRADEERLHIARELHDSLTHQISVIKVQAEVAVHLAQKRGEQVPESLLAIRDAGREAARELRATLEGPRTGVPAAVDRTAYRIVQESLTNISRHAAAATASVRIHYRPDAVAVRVDDDGKATPATAAMPGVGLLGMRERVTALGGRLRAEPRGEGGLTVH